MDWMDWMDYFDAYQGFKAINGDDRDVYWLDIGALVVILLLNEQSSFELLTTSQSFR